MEIEITRQRRGRMSAETAERLKSEVGQMVASGCSSPQIANALGIHVHTVYRWRSEQVPAGFRRVEVGPAVTGHGLTVVTATGHRVEGLSLEQAALLLRTLG